jgi:hypothetical protein
MTKTVFLSAVTAIALLGAGGYVLSRPADAQSAPPAATADGPEHMHPGPWGMHFGQFHHHHWMMARMKAHRGWGLFYHDGDKNLSAADVQTIAQAILLRHGNHTWKVANVTANQDNTVSFAYTTADGGVIARFSVDTKTGHIRRIA